MKNAFIILGLSLLFFTSCKKEQLSLPKAELTLEAEQEGLTELNLYNNEIHYDIMLPDDYGQSEVEIKVSTGANPTGIMITDKLSKGSYVDGRKEYNYLRATGIIKTGAFTDENRSLIKVNKPEDEIKVTIGDDVIEDQMDIKCDDALAIQYWPEVVQDEITASIFIYGYAFDGSQNPVIKVSCSNNTQSIQIQGNWNDPSQYNGAPPFNNYTFPVTFVRNGTTSGNQIGIQDNSEVYIEYKGVVYTSTFNDNTFTALKPL